MFDEISQSFLIKTMQSWQNPMLELGTTEAKLMPETELEKSRQSKLELFRDNERLKEQISKCQRVEQILLATKGRLKSLLACSPVVIYSRQPSDNYGLTFVSESITQFGYEPTQFLEDECFWKKCLHSEEISQILNDLFHLHEQEYQICEYRFLDDQGNYRWIQDQRKLIRDDTGNSLEIIGSWQDITERKRIEQDLFQEKELAQITLRSIGDGVITTDAEGYIEYLNPLAEEITGWKMEEVKKRPLAQVFKAINETSRKPTDNPLNQFSSQNPRGFSEPTLLIARDGTEYAIDASAAPICDRLGQIRGSVLVFRDVSKPRKLAQQLSWQANHDSLTELVNRRRFEQLLEEAIISVREDSQEHTLCYLDLDQFKVVNDNCGHLAGDELLRQLSILLKTQVRNSDILARLGGDEFGILLHQCPIEVGEQIADKIRRIIQEFRFVWQDNTFRIGVSIGLVAIDDNTNNLNSLLSAADAACYAAKDKGRNRTHIYQANDLELTQQHEERQWVRRINQALEEERFCLYYQPITPIALVPNSKGQHYEILLRMIDEDGTIIPPMAFIPAAERYGLMPKLDQWVIRTFFSRHQNLIKNGKQEVYTINLSGTSINDDQFLGFLKQQFLQHQVSPQTLCFEITETATIANLSKAVHFISEIKQLGCYFALDDFGSGMSSFAYLKNLPVDYLKIDGYFVKNILTNPIDSAMVDCINRIGHVIGIQTIAEFVENEEILEKLRDLGVDYAQGYGIAKPSLLVKL